MPVTTGALPATTAAETKPLLSKVIKPAILSNEAIFIMCLGRLRLAVTIIISLIRVNYFKANSAFTVTVIVLSSVEVSLFPSQVVAVEYIGFTWTTPIRAVRKCAITRPRSHCHKKTFRPNLYNIYVADAARTPSPRAISLPFLVRFRPLQSDHGGLADPINIAKYMPRQVIISVD
jgi:hypothetical protein